MMIDTADSEIKAFILSKFHSVDVDVVATLVDGQLHWDLDIKDHGNGGKIDLPKDSGGYRIEFELEDRTGLKLRFNGAGPIFASTDTSTCPSSLDTDQIMVDSCDKDELAIIDWNYGSETEIRYQLNFTDKLGRPVAPFDPIIRNGGGTPPGFL